MKKSIYLLPGRGGRLNKGLGAELQARGELVFGRELHGEFSTLPFASQVGKVADDLKSQFWDSEARVIANSFGAYLFLQAQAQSEPFPGRVLLISPIVGEAQDVENMMFFVPPRADFLKRRILSNDFPTPRDCQIHLGEYDWQSNPANVLAIGAALNIPISVVPGAGHRLPTEYVQELLVSWL